MSENYENMSNEEIKEQLEWSDHHEFSYNYAIWAFEEIDRLNNIIKELSKDVDMWNKKYNEQFNIIKELEEYCWELKAMGCREGALDMLDKLKKLKETNNV